MKDVIYVPLGVATPLYKARMRLVMRLINSGWKLEGKVVLTDSFNTKVEVIVLSK